MITSTAPPHVIAKIRHFAGPNPEGSKLTDIERLHLVGLVGLVMTSLRIGQKDAAKAVLSDVTDQLTARGLSVSEITAAIRDHEDEEQAAVAVADAIAVHPSLQALDYLD